MFHLCKSWEGQFFCASPTLEKLAKANLEEYFKRSHNKGFVWPLCVTVASTRNNLWVESANKKTNFALSQILEDKLFQYKTHLSTISSCSLSEISRVSTWYATTRLQIQARLLLLTFRQSTPRFQIMKSVVCQLINHHWHHLKTKEHHHDNGARRVETFPCETWGPAAVGKAGKLEIYFRSKEIVFART